MLFVRQLNQFCLKNGGPSLSDTLWYGHERQLKFFLQYSRLAYSAKSAHPMAYISLDTLVVIQMQSLHEKLLKLGKFFEGKYPEADQVVSKVRRMQAFMKALLTSSVHQTVKLFISYLLAHIDKERRFKNFADVFLAGAILNPNRDSRNLLSISEKETGRTYIRALADKICIQIDNQTENKQCSTSTLVNQVNPIDDTYVEICLHPKRPRIFEDNDLVK